MLQMTEMQLLSSFFYHNLGKEPASQSDCSCNLGLQIEWSFLPGQMLCCVPGLDTILKVLPATLEHIWVIYLAILMKDLFYGKNTTSLQDIVGRPK